MNTLVRVGVIGLGLMGSGIAEVCARAGLDVIGVETNPDALEAGKERVAHSLRRAVEKNKLSPDERDGILHRIKGASSIDELGDRDLVIEAATENLEAKLAIFAHLDAVLPSGAVLASNTSSIPLARIASATKRPESVIGVHFFNPAPVMNLVEIIPNLRTSEAVRETVTTFVRDQLGKKPILAKDRAGFVVNALLIPYMLSAVRMLEGGHSTAEDIDVGMKNGCGHPMGPLELLDLVGLDTAMYAAQSLYDEYHEPHLAPSPLLVRMVESGLLGRKSGQGFYSYA